MMPAIVALLAKFPGGLLQLMLAVPSIVKAFMEIMKALHEVEDYRERREKARQLADAIAVARRDKDAAKLEALIRGEAGAKDGSGV